MLINKEGHAEACVVHSAGLMKVQYFLDKTKRFGGNLAIACITIKKGHCNVPFF